MIKIRKKEITKKQEKQEDADRGENINLQQVNAVVIGKRDFKAT